MEAFASNWLVIVLTIALFSILIGVGLVQGVHEIRFQTARRRYRKNRARNR